jgi:hypothetical protein
MEDWPTIDFGWPEAVYGINFIDPVIRTEMERGFKARSTFTDARYVFGYVFLFSLVQFEYFKSWHANKITNGADWFNMPVKGATGIANQECRFTGAFVSRIEDAKFVRVTMPLEFRTDAIPNESTLDSWLT